MLYRELKCEKYWDMPAKTSDKKEKIKQAILTGAYGATIKKDGEYLRAIYDIDGEIYILGRGTKAKEIHNLNHHLPFITDWIKRNFNPGTCILGEIYVPGETSGAIRTYTGSLVKNSLIAQKKCHPRFYVFDIWALNGIHLMDKEYVFRIKTLKSIFELGEFVYIDHVDLVTGATEIFDFIGKAFENGEEGCVLVNLNSKVTPGKRTAWKTIKIKKEFQNNIDCFFTGNFTEPTRDYLGKELSNWIYWENSKTKKKMIGDFYQDYLNGDPIEAVTKPYLMGWPGSLEVGVYKDEKIVPICFVSGLSEALKDLFIIEPDNIIMRPIEITGMETTEASIRHPKFIGFRDDISLEDCQWSKIFGNGE